MFKDPNLEIGKVTYSELDIAKALNIDLRTLKKYESHLAEGDKPVMTLVPTKRKDPTTGLAIQERIFDFNAYNNVLALKFAEVKEELDTKVSKVEYDKLASRVRELEKLLNTKEITPDVIL